MTNETVETPTKRIEIYCREERLVVGHLPVIADGKSKDLNIAYIWHNYEPLEQRYQLGKQQRSGQFFSCPRCGGNLCIAGIREYPKGDKPPASAPKGAKPKERADDEQLVHIILGRTKVTV